MPVLFFSPAALLPVPVFSGGGLFSHQVLHHASIAHAERLLEHRRGCERYHDAVAFAAWKIQKRIQKDVAYKLWAVYNDCSALYITYWKVAYFATTMSRLLEALAGGSA